VPPLLTVNDQRSGPQGLLADPSQECRIGRSNATLYGVPGTRPVSWRLTVSGVAVDLATSLPKLLSHIDWLAEAKPAPSVGNDTRDNVDTVPDAVRPFDSDPVLSRLFWLMVAADACAQTKSTALAEEMKAFRKLNIA